MKISAPIDNKSLHENIHSTKQVHEKRLRINIAEIRRMKDTVELRYNAIRNNVNFVITLIFTKSPFLYSLSLLNEPHYNVNLL